MTKFEIYICCIVAFSLVPTTYFLGKLDGLSEGREICLNREGKK